MSTDIWNWPEWERRRIIPYPYRLAEDEFGKLIERLSEAQFQPQIDELMDVVRDLQRTIASLESRLSVLEAVNVVDMSLKNAGLAAGLKAILK